MSRKFISIKEKQDYKNEKIKMLMKTAKDLPKFMPQDWMNRLYELIAEAKNLDVKDLPQDDVMTLKPWSKNSGEYLKKEELKAALDNYFYYPSSNFSFEEKPISESIFDSHSITKALAKDLRLQLQDPDESIVCWSLTREANNRSEIWLIEFFMVAGHFFIFADCGRTDTSTAFKPNDKLLESLKEISDYVGLKFKNKDSNKNGWSNQE